MEINDKVTRPEQLLINGVQPEKLGKKVKLYKTDEFKGLNVNEIIEKAKDLRKQKSEQVST